MRRKTVWCSCLILAAVAEASTVDKSYYPAGVFNEEYRDLDSEAAERFTRILKAIGEPSLLKLEKGDKQKDPITVYRLLWVPSFDPPISVLIEKTGKTASLRVVRLDRPEGEEPLKVSIKKSKKLTEDDCLWLLVHTERINFRNLKPEKLKGLGVNDGDTLILEVIENGQYKAISRVEPEREFEKLSRFILDLSGLDAKEAWSKLHSDDENEVQ